MRARNPIGLLVIAGGLLVLVLSLLVGEALPTLQRAGVVGSALTTLVGYVTYHGGLRQTLRYFKRLPQSTIARIKHLTLADTAIPFTKPRFVLDGDALELVNSPTIPPEQIPDTIGHFAGSPLAEYDYFFDEANFADHWWLESRLFALFFDMLKTLPVLPNSMI